MLVIPELLTAKSVQDWMMARKSVREMRGFATEDGVEWTITQAYYAHLGGYVFEFETHFRDADVACQSGEKDLERAQHIAEATHVVNLAVAAEVIFMTENQGGKAFSNALKTCFIPRTEGPPNETPPVFGPDKPLKAIRFTPMLTSSLLFALMKLSTVYPLLP